MTPPITRRTLLRRTATLTTVVVAASTVSDAASRVDAGSEDPADVANMVARDHDPETGEIFDNDRHHHWDTV